MTVVEDLVRTYVALSLMWFGLGLAFTFDDSHTSKSETQAWQYALISYAGLAWPLWLLLALLYLPFLVIVSRGRRERRSRDPGGTF